MFPHAKSFGNVLTFTPPGFKQAINVKFPDSRLPVCVSCKKNFKTKDMCRVRNQHTGPPWTTAYICMTLDESCTDEDGKYVDKPFVVRMVQWRPYSVMEDFPPNSKTPVCATCKKTNRTRSFCRDRHKHRKLPWCTVYVMLSTQESADPSTVMAAPSRKIDMVNDTDVDSGEKKMNTLKSSTNEQSSNTPQKDTNQILTRIETGGNEESTGAAKKVKSTSDAPKKNSTAGGDDIHNIPESRTMLIQINDEETTINWLQLSSDDDSFAKGVWASAHQIALQQPNCITTGPTLIQSAHNRKYQYPPVAPAAVRVAKRDAESSIPVDSLHDPYYQHAIGAYPTAIGQSLAPALQHPYPYNPINTSLRNDVRTAPHYSGHLWPYPTAAIPPQQQQSIPHPYAKVQQRPISPVPPTGPPVGSMIGACSSSPTVTAGEAAAMRRKKPRREFETVHIQDLQHPHPSPPPPPVPSVSQLHQPPINYGQVPLAPGPAQAVSSPIHQHHQHPMGQIHQEQQQWMVYQQMYQAQLPIKARYTNDPSRMVVRTPENASRSFHLHDESPNNVTMTPGPGDGGGENDSDENDFSRSAIL